MTEIKMVNADDKHLTFNLSSGGVAVPFPVGSGATFTVKKEKNDTTIVIEKSSTTLGGDDTEVKLTDPGVIEVWLLPADTVDLYEGKYYYDLETHIYSDAESKTLKNTPIVDVFRIEKGLS